jgi:hypothetical protein
LNNIFTGLYVKIRIKKKCALKVKVWLLGVPERVLAFFNGFKG